MNKNENFSCQLLRRGLGYVLSRGRISKNLEKELFDHQNEAKKSKVGIWSKNLRLAKNISNFKEPITDVLNGKLSSAIVSDIYDSTEFFY